MVVVTMDSANVTKDGQTLNVQVDFQDLLISAKQNLCPNDCGGSFRGTCIDGKCDCKHGYSGDDCSFYPSPESSSGTRSPYLVVGVGVGILVVFFGAVGVIIFVVRKRRKPQFSQFELLETESFNIDPELDEFIEDEQDDQ